MGGTIVNEKVCQPSFKEFFISLKLIISNLIFLKSQNKLTEQTINEEILWNNKTNHTSLYVLTKRKIGIKKTTLVDTLSIANGKTFCIPWKYQTGVKPFSRDVKKVNITTRGYLLKMGRKKNDSKQIKTHGMISIDLINNTLLATKFIFL